MLHYEQRKFFKIYQCSRYLSVFLISSLTVSSNFFHIKKSWIWCNDFGGMTYTLIYTEKSCLFSNVLFFFCKSNIPAQHLFLPRFRLRRALWIWQPSGRHDLAAVIWRINQILSLNLGEISKRYRTLQNFERLQKKTSEDLKPPADFVWNWVSSKFTTSVFRPFCHNKPKIAIKMPNVENKDNWPYC